MFNKLYNILTLEFKEKSWNFTFVPVNAEFGILSEGSNVFSKSQNSRLTDASIWTKLVVSRSTLITPATNHVRFTLTLTSHWLTHWVVRTILVTLTGYTATKRSRLWLQIIKFKHEWQNQPPSKFSVQHITVADPGEGTVDPEWGGAANLLLGQNFLKTAWKWRKLSQGGDVRNLSM